MHVKSYPKQERQRQVIWMCLLIIQENNMFLWYLISISDNIVTAASIIAIFSLLIAGFLLLCRLAADNTNTDIAKLTSALGVTLTVGFICLSVAIFTPPKDDLILFAGVRHFHKAWEEFQKTPELTIRKLNAYLQQDGK